jgi:DNA-binding response OmpR family regulator
MSDIQFQPDWGLAVVPRPIQFIPASGANIPVLVADDDTVTLTLLNAIVTRAGFSVVLTKDGHEMMDALRRQVGPCIALVDWTMPGMDGAEVCQRIRNSGKSVYIIMLTARYQKEDAVKGLDAGADDYLTKPFDHDELVARMKVGIRTLQTEAKLLERLLELEDVGADRRSTPLGIPL